MKGGKKMFKLCCKMIIGGVIAAFVIAIIEGLTKSAGVVAYISNTLLDVKGFLLSILYYKLAVGMTMALVYTAVENGLKANNAVSKGLLFGFLVWMLFSLPQFIINIIDRPTIAFLFEVQFVTELATYPLAGAAMAKVIERYAK